MKGINFMLNGSGKVSTRTVVCLPEPDPNVTNGVNCPDHDVNYSTNNALPDFKEKNGYSSNMERFGSSITA